MNEFFSHSGEISTEKRILSFFTEWNSSKWFDFLAVRSFAEGLFSPDIAKYTELCKKARKKEYHYQQQVYYSNLLQEIVVNRQVRYTCI